MDGLFFGRLGERADDAPGGGKGERRQAAPREPAGGRSIVAGGQLTSPHGSAVDEQQIGAAGVLPTVEDGEQRPDGNAEPGLFAAFAGGSLERILAGVEEAGRQRPLSDAGADGAAGEQHPVIGDDQDGDRHLGVFEEDPAAGGAGRARLTQHGRDGQRCAAVETIMGSVLAGGIRHVFVKHVFEGSKPRRGG